MITTARGTMVVYRPVGETPGTCWIQAVNRKNKLADLENSAATSAYEQIRGICQLTEEELWQERNRSVFPGRHRIVLESLDLISRRIVQADLPRHTIKLALPPQQRVHSERPVDIRQMILPECCPFPSFRSSIRPSLGSRERVCGRSFIIVEWISSSSVTLSCVFWRELVVWSRESSWHCAGLSEWLGSVH